MDVATSALTRWLHSLIAGWQRFWFTPGRPHTLAVLRILGGTMILYTHVVWGKNLLDFLGPNAWVDRSTAYLLNTPPGGTNFTFSHLYAIESPTLLWITHLFALLVFASFMLGFYTRVTAVLTWLLTVSYSHRLVGCQYGLDQVNAFLAMYLMLSRCGDVYSIDAWLAARSPGARLGLDSSTLNTIALRLIQVHLCVIYLFGGVSKMRGEQWWDGSALWFAVANYEYQSLDVAWLVHARWLLAGLALVTMFWETFYCALAWPKWSRPVALALAVGVHGFIGLCLGMLTFGSAMIIMNLAFIEPHVTENAITYFRRRREPSQRF